VGWSKALPTELLLVSSRLLQSLQFVVSSRNILHCSCNELSCWATNLHHAAHLLRGACSLQACHLLLQCVWRLSCGAYLVRYAALHLQCIPSACFTSHLIAVFPALCFVALVATLRTLQFHKSALARLKLLPTASCGLRARVLLLWRSAVSVTAEQCRPLHNLLCSFLSKLVMLRMTAMPAA
jgi:hypothetical protein